MLERDLACRGCDGLELTGATAPPIERLIDSSRSGLLPPGIAAHIIAENGWDERTMSDVLKRDPGQIVNRIELEPSAGGERFEWRDKTGARIEPQPGSYILTDERLTNPEQPSAAVTHKLFQSLDGAAIAFTRQITAEDAGNVVYPSEFQKPSPAPYMFVSQERFLLVSEANLPEEDLEIRLSESPVRHAVRRAEGTPTGEL